MGPANASNPPPGYTAKSVFPLVRPTSVDEAGGRILVVDGEIVESDLTCNENAERSRANLKFRPKQAVQSTELRIYKLGGPLVTRR